MLKVGDKVKCIGEKVSGTINGAGWEKDYVFEINRISNGIAFGGIRGNGVYFQYLELINQELEIEIW